MSEQFHTHFLNERDRRSLLSLHSSWLWQNESSAAVTHFHRRWNRATVSIMKITRVNCSTSELDESQLRTVPGNIMLVTYRLLNSVYARALARYLAGSSLPLVLTLVSRRLGCCPRPLCATIRKPFRKRRPKKNAWTGAKYGLDNICRVITHRDKSNVAVAHKVREALSVSSYSSFHRTQRISLNLPLLSLSLSFFLSSSSASTWRASPPSFSVNDEKGRIRPGRTRRGAINILSPPLSSRTIVRRLARTSTIVQPMTFQ